jgi:hypothetical protein
MPHLPRMRLVHDTSNRNNKKFKGLGGELEGVGLLVPAPAAQALVVPGGVVNY